jgi:hypothetical protein
MTVPNDLSNTVVQKLDVSILRWKCGEVPAQPSRCLPSLSPEDGNIHFPKRVLLANYNK